MRKADLEILEMHLAPLRTTTDRVQSEINGLIRSLKDLTEEVTSHLRDADANDLAIKQALATVRSLIQRAHRLSKAELGEEEDEPEPTLDPEQTPTNVESYREAVRRRVRSQPGRSRIL